MVNYRNRLKYLAACVLLVSFFLPMSSCSYTVPLDLAEDESVPRESGKIKTELRTVIMYAREYNDFREPGSWLNLLSFVWPFFVIAFQLRFRGRWALLILPSAGVLLSVFTTAVIYVWADLGKPLIGAYVGWCAAAGLFAIYLLELAEGIRGKSSV